VGSQTISVAQPKYSEQVSLAEIISESEMFLVEQNKFVDAAERNSEEGATPGLVSYSCTFGDGGADERT
jgi:hypothetical protein